MPKVWVEIRV
jgi:hypothetical protein